jgi:nicotinic acid mononucleotide adenylyltransferase
MNKITTLFPGGFKPLTGAHLALAERYAQHPDTDKVILLIGPMPEMVLPEKKQLKCSI